ncbi:MAG: sigma-54 interaction domain-containing protein [Burkholderiaceae bacterium]
MRELEGVLVFDESGQARFASGLGKDDAVASTLSRLWRNQRNAPLKRVYALTELEHPLTVGTIITANGVCFLLFESGAADELAEFVATVDCADDIFRHFITNPYEAIVVVDPAGTLRYMSPVHEGFFGLRHGDAVGRPVAEVIENSRLPNVVVTGKAEIGQMHEMNGVTRIVSRTPIFNRHKRLVAAIGQVMFKGPQALRDMSNELARVRQERDFYKRELSGLRNRAWGLEQIVGGSDAIRRLKDDILRVAPLDVPVLLVGESGTGKELVAHAIHLLSPRSNKPMVLVNAAAMPANLIESELFGYEGGAFTGADRRGRKGKFEAADGSSLFLDEIGDMPLEMQVKLLRVLQDGGFERIGGDRVCHSDFRLISASNRDFEAMIASGGFRLDLFYRISAVTLRLPALRDRIEDIPELADTFLDAFARRHGVAKKALPADVVDYLQFRAWPGNVRQLQHAVQRAAIFCDGPALSVDDFGALEPRGGMPIDAPDGAAGRYDTGYAEPLSAIRGDVWQAKERVETDLIRDAMRRMRGNKKKVAEELGISRSYLYKRLRAMGMEGEARG